MGRKQLFKAKQVIAALKATKGMVYLAAERLGCEPATVYNYAKRYESVKAEIHKQEGIITDTAEIGLIVAIQNREPWAIKYRLNTKGRDRGYGDQTELKHSGEIASNVKVTVYIPDNGRNDRD